MVEMRRSHTLMQRGCAEADPLRPLSTHEHAITNSLILLLMPMGVMNESPYIDTRVGLPRSTKYWSNSSNVHTLCSNTAS